MAKRIILITGANSGVGYAASKVMVSSSPDFHVIMSGRALEKVESAMAEISALQEVQGTLEAIHLEVTDQASIDKAVEIVEKTHGRLDVLINNAAVGVVKESDLKSRLITNLTVNAVGPALVAEAFRPLLFKSENPYSIYVGSGAGSFSKCRPLPPQLAKGAGYPISKAAQHYVALLEHVTYGPQGLKVFIVCPGCVRSNLRGTSEEERDCWGQAGDPDVSGHTLLKVINGERDADVGKIVNKDGIYAW